MTMVLTGPNGPKVFNLPVDTERNSRDIFRNWVHETFKTEVFPHWEPQHEVLSLRFGAFALALMPTVFAAQANTRILNLHQLPRARYLFRFPPIIVASTVGAISTMLTQSFFVESDIIAGIQDFCLLFKDNEFILDISISGVTPCALCVQTRSMGLQFFTGLLFPYLIAASGTFHSLSGMPGIHQTVIKSGSHEKIKVKSYISWIRNMTSRSKHIILFNAGFQFIGNTLIIGRMQREWWHVSSELYKFTDGEDIVAPKENE